MPKEPWYYGFLAGYARLVAVIAVLPFVATLIVLAITVSRNPDSAADTIIPVLTTAGVLLLTLLFVAPILILVDLARNIRAMRYGRDR
jgi:hypothetical protein